MSNTSKYALAIAVLLGATQAQAAKYTYTDLGSLNVSVATAINSNGDVAGVMDSYYIELNYGYKEGTPTVWSGNKQTILDAQHIASANAINDAGAVAGSIYVGRDAHAAVFSNGKVTDLGAQNGFTRTSVATAINNSGRVAGYADTGEDGHAISWDKNGNATDLHTQLGSAFTFSTANGINNKGDIVGYGYSYLTGVARPVLWSNGQANVLGDTDGYAYAINDRGQVVGQSLGRATLWQNGQAVALDPLSSRAGGTAYAINNRGDVVGSADTLYDNFHAVLWSNGQAIDLNQYSPAQDWVLRAATGINDKGVIVGYAQDWTGWDPRWRAFMLTPVAPVPEADTYAMMLGGFALFGVMRRRARKA